MQSKYTKELLEPLVKSSTSVSQVLGKLNLKNTGGNYRHVQSKIKVLDLDTSHFNGQAWSKGKKLGPCIARRYLNEEIFTENSSYTNVTNLRNRAIELGLKYKCSTCGINEWLDKELTLHLDHINGTHNDNRFENLQFLCPNCHQQTSTWGNKNRKLCGGRQTAKSNGLDP